MASKHLTTWDGLNIQAITAMKELLKSTGWQHDGNKWVPVEPQRPDGVLIKEDSGDKRLVFGWANVIKDVDDNLIVDRQGDFIDDDWELEKAAYDYSLYSRDGGNMHVRKGVSSMVESMVFTPEKTRALGIPDGIVPTGWWLGFSVHDDETWAGVKSEEFSGFSIHGAGLRKEYDLTGMPHVIPA
jgi:hypothetical protein